jgi:hypothetical protein
MAARGVTKVVLIAFGIYFLMPVIWMIIASTKTNAQLATTFGFWFSGNSLAANWEALQAWTGGMFPRWVAQLPVLLHHLCRYRHFDFDDGWLCRHQVRLSRQASRNGYHHGRATNAGSDSDRATLFGFPVNRLG